jgi:CRISPR-associated protein (TIGR03986 family)
MVYGIGGMGMRGKIKFIHKEKSFGKIQVENRDDVYFRTKDCRGLQPGEGLEVEFDIIREIKGDRAENIRPLSKHTVGISASPAAESSNYRFLNPYNFVTPLPQSKKSFFSKQNPPPHSYYQEYSGYISCNLEVITPLFISSGAPKSQNGPKGDHPVYSFFSIDGQNPTIPATSLRGMIRSIYEAVTNSCFAIFDDQKCTRRMDSNEAGKLIPARLTLNEGKWTARLYKGRTLTGFPNLQAAAWIKRYDHLDEKQVRRPIIDLGTITHGSLAWAVMKPIRHPKKPIFWWDVQAIFQQESEARQWLRKNYHPDYRIEEGYVYISGKNTEKKHDERFFFGRGDSIEVSQTVIQEYNGILKDYRERHQEALKDKSNKFPKINPKGKKESAVSSFMWRDDKLQDGDLVYAMVTTVNGKETIDYLVPVQISRRYFPCSRGEMLPEYLKTCEKYEELCPACRLFGWVGHNQGNKELRGAYAGRVRISQGVLIKDLGRENPVTLAELGSPKPTTTFFYLSEGGKASFIRKTNGYKKGQQIRGRKLYRHHGSKFVWQRGKKTNRNRTLLDPVKAGSIFSFTIRYENLTEKELGALVWSIKLEEGLFHRLGYGKPLGMGSVKVSIDQCKRYDYRTRYTSLFAAGEQLCEIGMLIEKFKRMYIEVYGRPFDELETIKDLKAILSEHPERLPIHYPRLNQAASEDGDENFRWFMEAAKPKNEAALALAREDQGLPLMYNRRDR